MTAIMMTCFLTLMVLGMPLYVSLLVSAFAGIAVLGDWSILGIMAQQFYGGMDVFSLMAIPFFIFAGILMNRSGLTDRMLDFSRLLVGSVRGGLGYVNVVGSIILSGVNGSAAADASALGSILIPAMVKEGFTPAYSAGLTSSSSLIGPIIPPSIFMIIYATMTNTSIGGLFAAGLFPGLLLGVAFMIMNWHYSKKHAIPVSTFEYSRVEKLQILGRSAVALVAPVIIIGGIITGIVTPTESGALAVGYCTVAGFLYTKELDMRIMGESLYEAVRLTSSVFLIIGSATVVGWLLKWEQVPQRFAELIIQSGLIDSPWLLMVVLSTIIFPVGMFMEEVSTLTLLTPIFAPLAVKAGLDPLHFGIVMTLNVTIALITPPMGACNYIVAAVGNVGLGQVFRVIWPFIGVAFAVLMLLITFPFFCTFLPSLLGL